MSGDRCGRLAATLREEGLDALVISDPANLYYLTGFTGSNGLALVSADGTARFFTDFRYREQTEQEVDDAFVSEIVSGELLDAAAAAAPAGRLGFEDRSLTVRRHARLAGKLPAATEAVAAGPLVEQLRTIKDGGELERIREAARLVDEIYAWVLERGLEGRTERSVAVDLEHEMRLRGADGPSFPSIVASGQHGALPHAAPRDEPIPSGVLVTIDIGARMHGYCSDCTRTFAVGSEPDERTRDVYEIVLQAQLAGVRAVAPGPTGAEVDAFARAVIDAAGFAEEFGHGLGHGVGIEVHEAPRLSRQGGEETLEAGNVVTIEPGVYLPGELGVRIEDLVFVTVDGHEIVSGFTKQLLVVD